MKVLITGGAGFLGINLVRYLLGRGVTDIVVLDINDFTYPESAKIKFIKGDIRDKAVVEEAMKGIEQVVHAAAALPLYKKRDIYSTDVQGTRNVLAAAYQSKVERFIHISSTAVYGIPDHHPLRENEKLQGVGHYGQAKIMAEEAAQEYRQKGMCVPIIRPKSFVGPERLGIFALFYEWASEGKNFPMIGSGNNRYQLLDVEDLCAFILLCATGDKAAVNDTFNIGAQEFTTIKEDYQAVLDEAGYGKKIIPFPAKPAVMILRVLEFLRLSPLYRWIYETVSEDSFVAIDKALSLGFAPCHSNKQALLRNYHWYLKNRDLLLHETGISHRVPWKQGVLRFLKTFF
jgi:nucleoside-diphosphate-sugar epimerase